MASLSTLLTTIQDRGFDLTPLDFADGLWLSTHLFFVSKTNRVVPKAPDASSEAADATPSVPDDNQAQSGEPTTDGDAAPTSSPLDQDSFPAEWSSAEDTESDLVASSATQGAEVYAKGGADGKQLSGHPIRIPEAPVLSRMLEMERALRPIARREPSKQLRELDEAATVNFIANTGIWSVVERPAKERWLEGVLVVEQSPTMRPWQDTARELRNLFWRIGAFRWLEYVHLDTATPQTRLNSPVDSQQRRSLRSICRPESSRAIFLCTDCLSDAWLSGRVAEALAFWTQHHPSVIIQMLPEEMWRRTSLRRANFVVGASTNPATHPKRLNRNGPGAESRLLSVVSTKPESLHQLAQFLVAAPRNRILCYSNPAEDFCEVGDTSAAIESLGSPAAAIDASQIFSHFIETVSPLTVDLARNLASAPLLLPVMRLIQYVLVPNSQPAHLAELFNSGILRRLSSASAKENLNQIEYEFVGGIRDILLGQGSFARVSRVWTVLDDYLSSRFERGGDFSAILKDPSSAKQYASGISGAAREPFARVFSIVLTRLGGEFIKAAEQINDSTSAVRVSRSGFTEQRSTISPGRPSAIPKGWIWSVAVSPDGKWLTSASQDETVKIWDLETGDCRAELSGHTGQVTTVAITPDGKRILSGSADNSIRMWDANSGEVIATFRGHASVVWSVHALGDNDRILSGGWDGTLRLWDIATRSCQRVIRVGTDAADQIVCCAVNGLGTEAISGQRDGRLRLWNLESGECVRTLLGHSSIVNTVQITPDGRFAISGSSDMTLKVWDLVIGNCVGTLEGHQDVIQSVAISPNDTLIASTGSQDHSVRLWDWKSGMCLQIIADQDHWTPISLAFTPDGSRLVIGTENSTIYVYRLSSVHPTTSVELGKRYVNAKVVLLGEGTVGKTSLAHRLIEDQYVIRDRTHGMNVWRLELPLPPDATLEREALLWDLAGQEDYRLIHQLFLDETALALLLVNPQNDDPFAEAGDWLKALESSGRGAREAARLLIFSQADVGGLRISAAKIERFREQYGFANWLSTSAKTGENCSDKENDNQPSRLKQLIAESIPWDRLPWTSTPHLLAELKNAMLGMRDMTDIRLVRFAELAQRLEQTLPDERFGESDVRTAVTLLANHGLARPLQFGDLVLLQPELLNGYAGAIIRAARAHVDEIGSVREVDIYRPDFDFTGVERLKHRPDEELLLRELVETFINHSLCIAEYTPEGRQLVFPSQYRREKDLPRDPEIFVSYTFSGEWQTVWTTLVVRLWYSQEFEHRELWRNAAEFATAKGQTLGLKIDHLQGEGIATISLYFDMDVPDELTAIFIEYVHRHLAKYGLEVSRDRRYVCPTCRTPVRDLDAVRKRLDSKKEFIYCQTCDEKVPLIDFIEQRLKSDPVARKILAMDATATRELDTQALEQILIGHMMAISGEANQIFRPTTLFDYGIDGEVEFKDDNGKPSGKKIYVQLKAGNSYLRTRRSDGSEIFDVRNESQIEFWTNQPVDVYLVIRQTDEARGGQTIRWMNVTRYLQQRKNKKSRQIIFKGEKLDMEAVWKVRDEFFPPTNQTRE